MTAGSAAVEFAVVLPVALLVYIGAAEVADGVMASRRATSVAATLVNLVSLQGTTTQAASTPTPGNAVSASTLSTLLTSAATLMASEPTNTLSMTVSAIDITNNPNGYCCQAYVRWSYTQNGILRPCVVTLTALPSNSDYAAGQIPVPLLPYGTQLPSSLAYIIADVSYTYQPIFNISMLNFVPTMQRTVYIFPRSTGQVTTSALPAGGTQHGLVCY